MCVAQSNLKKITDPAKSRKTCIVDLYLFCSTQRPEIAKPHNVVIVRLQCDLPCPSPHAHYYSHAVRLGKLSWSFLGEPNTCPKSLHLDQATISSKLIPLHLGFVRDVAWILEFAQLLSMTALKPLQSCLGDSPFDNTENWQIGGTYRWIQHSLMMFKKTKKTGAE